MVLNAVDHELLSMVSRPSGGLRRIAAHRAEARLSSKRVGLPAIYLMICFPSAVPWEMWPTTRGWRCGCLASPLHQAFSLFFLIQPFDDKLLQQRLIPDVSLRGKYLDPTQDVLIEAHRDRSRARAG